MVVPHRSQRAAETPCGNSQGPSQPQPWALGISLGTGTDQDVGLCVGQTGQGYTWCPSTGIDTLSGVLGNGWSPPGRWAGTGRLVSTFSPDSVCQSLSVLAPALLWLKTVTECNTSNVCFHQNP